MVAIIWMLITMVIFVAKNILDLFDAPYFHVLYILNFYFIRGGYSCVASLIGNAYPSIPHWWKSMCFTNFTCINSFILLTIKLGNYKTAVTASGVYLNQLDRDVVSLTNTNVHGLISCFKSRKAQKPILFPVLGCIDFCQFWMVAKTFFSITKAECAMFIVSIKILLIQLF